LRPILMTACAMTVGMVPMSLALEAGSQLEAPLGRAVIGGLLVSTFSTLLMLPAIFTIVMGKQVYESPSLHPDDIHAASQDEGAAHEKSSDGQQTPGPADNLPPAEEHGDEPHDNG
jgi:AcrB/AcrD/AcrF family